MKNIGKEQNEWSTKMNSLIGLLKKRKSITIIVGEQVGWSLVSEYKIGNTYIVIGLLIAATIIPLATWWYFSK